MAKFRGSWAQVGNDTDPYIVNSAYSFTNAVKDGKNIYTVSIPGTVYTQNLKPERKTSWEFGLDWRFVNNRFGIDFAYYKENTKDQIMSIPVPGVAGISSKLVNAGNIENKGIELALNATPIETKDWTWDVSLTYTRNRSKIVELHPDAGEYLGLSGYTNAYNYRIGSVAKVGGAYGLLMSDSAPKIDKDVEDENGNVIKKGSGLPLLRYHNTYNAAWHVRNGSVEAIGDINPKFLGSVSTSLRWKNLRLNVALDGRWGGYVASYDNKYGTGSGTTEYSLKWRDEAHGGMKFTSIWNGKTYNDGMIPEGIFPTGTSIKIPGKDEAGKDKFYTVGTGQYETGETYRELMAKGILDPQHAGAFHYWENSWGAGVVNESWFHKLNYVALREVSLSYSLPNNIASKLGAKGINLTATGHNLGYLHNSMKNGVSPESVRGTNSAEFRVRNYEGTTASFTFTVNAQF